MENHEITGVGFKFDGSLITIELFDCEVPKDEQDSELEPFAEFNVNKDSYSALMKSLFQIGINIQEQCDVDLGLPRAESDKAGE